MTKRPPDFQHVATLPCEIFFLKNRHVSELSGANYHEKLSHLKQLLKNIHPMMLAHHHHLRLIKGCQDATYTIYNTLTDEEIFTVVTSKNPKNLQVYATGCSNQEKRCNDKTPVHTISVQTVTGGVSRRITSGRENTSLILVDHGVKVIEGCYRNMTLL